jgi:hypothetical protein
MVAGGSGGANWHCIMDRMTKDEAPEEVFAVEGEIEEIFAQHTENWITHDDSKFSNSR